MQQVDLGWCMCALSDDEAGQRSLEIVDGG